MANQTATDPLRQLARNFLYPIPSHLAKHHIQIDEAGLGRIEQAIREHYHRGWRSEESYTKAGYQADLDAHVRGRLESDRRQIIPWIDDAARLSGKRVLEIGCGTGSSTIALAEQGAKVTGIDIDEDALLVAKQRAEVYGVDADFHSINAEDIPSTFRDETFDLIIFFACLEHMTIKERLSSLKDAWDMLPPGGLLVVVETPNRLWYFDDHTAKLPFYHWLPNELAFAYARFSDRKNFRELYTEYDASSKEHFLRRGRGMSFHEFDLSIGHAGDLKVVSSLSTYQGIRYKIRRTRAQRRYKSFLNRICPDVHEGFFDETLFLIIQKNELAPGR